MVDGLHVLIYGLQDLGLHKMTPKQVKRRVATLQRQIESARAKLEAVQEICPHVNALHKNRADTGNYDGVDTYWTEHHCYDCDRRWTTDQDWDRKR